MDSQLAFTALIAEAEDARREQLDRHRDRVQRWFDALPEADKRRWADWMTLYQWDTCVALAAAAGDWSLSHPSRDD